MTEPLTPDGACRLDDLGVIRARGADAAAFLQGQLTNDVLGLDDGHARLAAFCSAKGRMQASFVVWRNGPDELLLACARDLLAPTLKRLSMFVLRAKCKLDDATGEVALWGVVGGAVAAHAGAAAAWQRGGSADGHGSAIRLPDAEGRARGWLVRSSDAPPPVVEAMTLPAWRWLDVSSGIVTVVAATVDRFVPQMVNLERVGGVDFRKGCYPGQEVVARSQYRGTLKRRAFLYDVAAPAAPGDDVYADGQPGEPVGTVANAASDPAGVGSRALVELRLSALDAPLRLGSVDGPALIRAPMPYDVPLEADADA